MGGRTETTRGESHPHSHQNDSTLASGKKKKKKYGLLRQTSRMWHICGPNVCTHTVRVSKGPRERARECVSGGGVLLGPPRDKGRRWTMRNDGDYSTDT